MTEHELDTRGALCPQPIIDLGKLMRRIEVGDLVHVRNDDAAFPYDLRAWCDGTGHELLSLASEGREHRATLRKVARG